MQEQLAYYEDKLRWEIDSWDLDDARKRGENVIVIDARGTAAYETEHIAGAVNLPHRDMNETTTSALDKKVLYVTYCDGIGCNASTKGARNMTRLGFTVKELIGGLDWWKRDGYPTERGEARSGIKCGC